MKKSHRKDVMIARIIFAAMCIALIAIIAGVVMLVRAHRSKPTPNQVTQQTQSQMQDTTRNDVIDIPDTQDTQVAEMTYLWTTDGVVVTILEMGTQVRMIGEEDGWVKVSYNDQEGYIRADFLTTEQ